MIHAEIKELINLMRSNLVPGNPDHERINNLLTRFDTVDLKDELMIELYDKSSPNYYKNENN